MSETKKYPIWMKQKLYERKNNLIDWMHELTGRSITGADSLRLLFKAWDSLTEKKRLKLMEGE